MGFYICRVIRFYHIGRQEILETPIETFWLLLRNIDRLRSEELIEELIVRTASSGESAKQLLEELKARKGNTLVLEHAFDRDALKNLKEKMSK